MTQEEFTDVVALRRQGFTITDIAAKIGRHLETVSKWLEQGGPSLGAHGGDAGRGGPAPRGGHRQMRLRVKA
jgi:transposase